MDTDSNILPVTVLLPVYHGDSPDELEVALQSLENQTRIAAELLVIEDGPLTEELVVTLQRATKRYGGNLRRHSLSSNQGLPTALQIGVEQASQDLIVRMDSDDISISERLDLQYEFLQQNPDIDVVGGQLVEIDPETGDQVAKRKVPLDHDEIEKMAKRRSPMNHGTVMMRRSKVLAAGNYRRIRRMEDYDLWVRMLLNGSKFANLDEVLLQARAGEDLSDRRGGIEYAIEEFNRQLEFLDRGFTHPGQFVFNLATRGTLRLLPNNLRSKIYDQFARST